MNTTRIDGPGIESPPERYWFGTPWKSDAMYPPESEWDGLHISGGRMNVEMTEYTRRVKKEPSVTWPGEAVVDCLVDHGDGPCTCAPWVPPKPEKPNP